MTTSSWEAMILAEAREEANVLAELARRTAREYRETGAEQPYQNALVALTARIAAVPVEQAGAVISSLLGIIAWNRRA